MSDIMTDRISVAYGDRSIIRDLSIKIPEGKITTIIGPNGCGKSTLLKTMGRIHKQKRGIVYLNGKDIHSLSTKEVAEKMAILPQTPKAPEGLRVRELVSYGRFPYQRGLSKETDKDRDIINWALEVTKLKGFSDRVVDNLSGGQRQRVWIAMALAQQTDLILLDEPTTYLDLTYQLEVLELLYKLNREEGSTIVMVLHDLNLASRFADYMVAIRDGEIIHSGSPEEVMNKDILKETFSIDAMVMKDPRTEKLVCISYELIKDEDIFKGVLI
ncbi:ABC transporter ATP-binding protein [Alkaliphilus sp. MSJ-5]|uniref:ABC transporter ATP-binding protein n=1 Tax=Alkaliphilus flagellatus TaxID=2841507 RepID=A0ABS6FYJ7_9FIRM|nr:ABC transporter ATP-binding protein [Alkaliphilus flagellatus]MBU5675294.1 ABC transporter ATP-binding protein [Alkaliphilus flagellatus]